VIAVAGGVFLATRDEGTKPPVKTPGTTASTSGGTTGNGGTGQGGGSTLPGQEATRPRGGSTAPKSGPKSGPGPDAIPGAIPGGGADCPNSLAALQGHYHESDCAHLTRIFAEAIGAARASGATWRWSNRTSGNRGTMTVLGFFQSKDGRYCRRIRQTLVSRGETLTDSGVGCREGTGWRISRAE
jgi:surface antigen